MQLRRANELGGANVERDSEIRRALGEERCVHTLAAIIFFVLIAVVYGRRKLAEALAMTERVAEIVRAMEPRFVQLLPPFFPPLCANDCRAHVTCRFGAMDRELSQHTPQPSATLMSPVVSWTGNQVQGATSPDTGDDFFVA